jgi:hypothetical protein
MTHDRLTEQATKGIMLAFTFGFFFWYITMKLMALRLGDF